MATGKVRAVYRNKKGATFSAPIEKHGDTWIMQTSDGPVPIAHTFQDDVGGLLTFVEYRQEVDTRLHIDRLPGESSFGALKRAYAEKEIAEQRKQRQVARTQIQDVPPDPAKIAAARELNNEIAKTMKPRGGGAGLVVNPPMSRAEAEIQARLRRR